MTIRNPYIQSRIVVPAVILLFMLAYLATAIGMGPLFLDGGVSNENFFPVMLVIVGMPLALKLLFDNAKEIKKETAEKGFVPGKLHKTPLILSGVTALFIACYVLIGFLPAAFIYVYLFLLFFDDKLRQPIRKLVYAALITAVVYVLYAVVFNIHF